MTYPEHAARRQLPLFFDVSFGIPAGASLDWLDEWLTILEIPAAAPAMPPAEAWLSRALLLARDWFQAGRVPVFDPPEIAALKPEAEKPGRWQAKVRLALIEHLPHGIYCKMLDNALLLSAWMAARRPDARSRQAVFAKMRSLAGAFEKCIGAGASTLPVLAVAHRMGIPFLHLGGGVFQLGWGNRARRLDRSVTCGDSAIGSKLCQNKMLTAGLLRAGGLPAPVHEAAATADAALAAAKRLGWPVVVKPVARDGGVGVTIDVADETGLRAAFATATAAGRGVLVEKQASGVSHRLFVAHGALLFALKRRPMGIYGNGVQTVAELTAAEVAAQQRRPPWKRSLIKPLDAQALAAMGKAGFAPETVPDTGAYVPLRLLESPSSGGLSEDAGGEIHPENAAAAIRAAQLLGLRVAGIDFITTDIGKPWQQTGAIINEVNFSPMLGASEISRRPIPIFLEGLMGGNGRIPVHVYIGGATAWRAGARHWRDLLDGGAAACITSAVKTFSPDGQEWRMPLRSAGERGRALILSPRTGAIILVISAEEFWRSGLPFDAVEALVHVGADPETRQPPDQLVT